MRLNPTIKSPRWFLTTFSGLHKGWYRLTGGRLGRTFHGAPLVLLTTTGRKSGEERTWPLLALRDGDAYLFAASNSGHDHHPAWYLNLEANPAVTVRDGGTTLHGHARITTGSERTEKYQRFIDVFDNYAKYEQATERQIPVVVVEPA